jgi:hypothetical protein
LSSDGLTFYVNSGSTTYAYSNANGYSRGLMRWSRSGDIKTKPILLAGDAVYTVERSNGQIIKQDAISGVVLSEFPFTATFGMASGAALLSGGTILTIYDGGVMVATCISLCDGETASPTNSPVAGTDAPVAATNSPVAATNSPVATTDAPVAVTNSPVAATDAPVAATNSPVGQFVGTPNSGASPTNLLLGIATIAVAMALL